MSTVAIIPARGGSKGVPRKNVRLVGGRSLLARAVASCREVNGIATIAVSSDDAEILVAAADAGAVPITRPAHLASDVAPTLPVLTQALEALAAIGHIFETIVLCEPTSPFRTRDDVAAALSRWEQGDCGSVVSVMPLDRKPENIFVREQYLTRYIREPGEHFARRQDMQHLCRLNSAVYVTSVKAVQSGLLMPKPVGWVAMDERSSINIDTELDLAFADWLATRYGI